MKKVLSFNEALKELQTIVAQMEGDDVNIDTLANQVKRAQELIGFCKKQLLKTENEVKKLTEDK